MNSDRCAVNSAPRRPARLLWAKTAPIAWLAGMAILGNLAVTDGIQAQVADAAEAQVDTAEGSAEDSASLSPTPVAEPEATEESANTDEARQRFRQGLALADSGNCSGALAEFAAALALIRRPSILYNMARCQEQLNRYDLAITAYGEFIAEADAADPDVASARSTVEQLARLLGTIVIEANVTAEVWVDDRIVGQAPGDVLIPGGLHVLELRASGRLAERREVQVSAGARVSISVELQSAQEIHQHQSTTNVSVDAPPLPIELTIGMIAASALTLGTGIGFGIHALSLSDTEHARDGRLPRDADAIDSAALLSDVFLIGGGVLSIATLAMAFLTDWGSETSDDSADVESSSVRVTPIVGLLYAGIRIEGIE